MRTTADRGRVYRRCGCRDTHRRQLGAHCPRMLIDGHHGTWTFAVDVPAPARHRTTVRRGGFTSHDAAEAALRTFLEGEAGGFNADPNQTVADYLNTWLTAKTLVLKPTTMARYRDYAHNDLVPAFGSLKLDELRHRHISAFVTGQLAAGRGRTTLYRCLATLSSALGDAVRQHRLAHNPASPPALRRPPAPERRIWTTDEAVRFLRHCHTADPDMADLFELLIGTGLRKGEALGLHWDDVHLREGVLYVRCTLSAIDNNRLVITAPKTRSSRNWVAISPRVASALRRRARSTDRSHTAPGGPFTGLVFCRPDGRPLRPRTVLDRLRELSDEAGVPPGYRSRPAPPGRHPHHHRRRPAHRGLQDPAPLHPVHHGQHLQPPHPAGRPRSRRDHRTHPHPGRTESRPSGPADAAALTTRPHPTAARGPPPAPLPRPAALQRHRGPAATPACDHQPSRNPKGRPPATRERPPTCIKAGRDDRI